MKTLFLECNMGAAGDMLTAALLIFLDITLTGTMLNEKGIRERLFLRKRSH